MAWEEDDPYLYNAAFDPSLIAHDQAYCTTVRDLTGAIRSPLSGTLTAFSAMPSIETSLTSGAVKVSSYAPFNSAGSRPADTTRSCARNRPSLHSRYWRPTDEADAGLFVMRCVLPHIPEPWEWIRSMGEDHPRALLLIEYQRLEWMAEHDVWYQLAHDHVNQFTVADFAARFEVVDQGNFANDEWAWVVIRPDTYRRPAPRGCDLRDALDGLIAARHRMLTALTGLRVALWGAAGKGIILAHALTQAGAEVSFAVDADPARQGKFMDVSGVEVIAPEEAIARLTDHELVVCNPNHRRAVRELVAAHRRQSRRD